MGRCNETDSLELREYIIDVAECMISENASGEKFSMCKCAERASVSPTTLYNFYGSKPGLYKEILQRSILRDLETFNIPKDINPDLDALTVVGKRFIILMNAREDLIRTLCVGINGEDIKAVADFTKPYVLGWVVHQFKTDDSERIANNLLTVIAGNLFLWLGGSISPDQIVEQIMFSLKDLPKTQKAG